MRTLALVSLSSFALLAACAHAASIGDLDDVAPAANQVAAPPAATNAFTGAPSNDAGGIGYSSALVTSVPSLSGVSPMTVLAGSQPAGLQVTLTGAGFSGGATVASGLQTLQALVVNDTTITLTIPPSMIAAAGIVPLSVVSSSQTRSNEVNVTVVTPDMSVAALSSLEPSSITAHTATGDSIALLVHGAAFDSATVVVFDGTGVSTVYQGQSLLVATVPNSLLRTARVLKVAVKRGGVATAPLSFRVVAPSTSPGGGTSSSGGFGQNCGNRDTCDSLGLKKGECVGDFPTYTCGSDGCLIFGGGC